MVEHVFKVVRYYKKKRINCKMLNYDSFFVAYGARCTCPEDYSGNYCQYQKTKLKAKSTEDTIPHVEYKQFDAETLAVIANLGGNSPATNDNTQRTNSLSVASGNRSQFVFCLTNPCENGGTCFVTNTATTKVR